MSLDIKYCAPGKRKNKFTCFSYNSLIKIAGLYNKKNPDDKIDIGTKDKGDLWKDIQDRLIKNSPCKYDYCLLDNKLLKNNNDVEMNFATFLPPKPDDWNENPKAWLSTTDIRNVLLQYEDMVPEFEFIGPVPIDFDKKVMNKCIVDELCKLSVDKLINNKKTKLGIVFNLDAHDMPGSHWVSMYADFNNGGIYFFDSVGKEPVDEIKNLMVRIRTQGNNYMEKNNNYMNHFDRKYQITVEGVKKISDKELEFPNKLPKFIENMILEYYCDKKDRLFSTKIKSVDKNRVTLSHKIDTNCQTINIIGFRMFYNDFPHQKKDSECGTYSINFIASLLKGQDFYQFSKAIVNDDTMNSFRDKYFRPSRKK